MLVPACGGALPPQLPALCSGDCISRQNGPVSPDWSFPPAATLKGEGKGQRQDSRLCSLLSSTLDEIPSPLPGSGFTSEQGR